MSPTAQNAAESVRSANGNDTWNGISNDICTASPRHDAVAMDRQATTQVAVVTGSACVRLRFVALPLLPNLLARVAISPVVHGLGIWP